MTKKTKELGSQKAQPVSARAGSVGRSETTPVEPKEGLTKGVELSERGHQLAAACDYLEETLLDIGVIDTSAKKVNEAQDTKVGSRHTAMDGLCDLQGVAYAINDAVYVFVNGSDMGEDCDGNDADSEKGEKTQTVVEKTDFGRRVLVKSRTIHGLFASILDNLKRIEHSLLRQEPAVGVEGSQGPRGPVGGGVPDLSAIDLIQNLEEAAHGLEMRIMHLGSRLRETY